MSTSIQQTNCKYVCEPHCFYYMVFRQWMVLLILKLNYFKLLKVYPVKTSKRQLLAFIPWMVDHFQDCWNKVIFIFWTWSLFPVFFSISHKALVSSFSRTEMNLLFKNCIPWFLFVCMVTEDVLKSFNSV